MSKVSDLVSQLEQELLSSKDNSRAYLQECLRLNMQVEKLEKLLVKTSSESTLSKIRTVGKTTIHVTEEEQETLHLAMNVLHQQGFINTQGYIKMLEVLKVK